MDPISIGALTRPIVFFMTRSDVFTPLTKPILWACHMLPIYRQRDGVNTKEKNKESFRKSSQVLKNGRNLLIFGEGETYDVFVRHLKPIKKGAVRMGFIALESMDWKKKIYISAIGINYSEPNRMRSDYLMAYSDRICLNDYRSDYETNANRTIADLTKKVEDLMKTTVTHVENKDLTPLHENIMMLTRKGIHPICFDKKTDLKIRWEYSRALASKINEANTNGEDLSEIREMIEHYLQKVKKKKLSENDVYLISSGKIKEERSGSIIKLIFLFLPMIPGMIHFYLPYHFAKNFAEKKFKRKVFWGSVKLVAGFISMGLFNIPFIFLFHAFIYPNYWLALLYYFLTPFFGLAAWEWFTALKNLKHYKQIERKSIEDINPERKALLEMIEQRFSI